MTTLLDPQQSYTFSKIFDLRPELDILVNELGYALRRVPLALPVAGELDRLGIKQLSGNRGFGAVNASFDLLLTRWIIVSNVTNLAATFF
jgi:hypothetical protein